jgi:hemicentin
MNSSVLYLNYTNEQSVHDGGVYKCSAMSIDGASNGVSSSILIIFSPHFFIQPLPLVQAMHNDTGVTLTCGAIGFPSPTIEWKRLTRSYVNTSEPLEEFMIDLPEQNYNDTVTGTFNETVTLTIDPVEYEDYGYYICVATIPSSDILEISDCCNNNSVTSMVYQEISSIAILSISPHGSVSVSPEASSGMIGDSISLNCSSRGGPNNQYQWSHSGVSVGNESSLTLELSSISEFGQYKCTVGNQAGNGTDSSYVQGLLSQ